MALISLHDISLTFGGHPLFDRISLQVEEGDRLCLLGRNGEGKSTLLRIIEGMQKPDSGELARSPGLRVAGLGQEVPQNLVGRAEDLITHGVGFGEPGADTNHADLHSQDLVFASICMDQLGIDPDTEFSTSSGGMRRRILLACALVQQPDILFLDEPTNHLDINTIQWLEAQLLSHIKTCIFITHDRRFARRIANRIAEIDRGNIYSFKATFDQFLERREELYAAEIKQRALFDKRLAQEEVWIRQGVQARRTRDEGRVKALIQMRKAAEERRDRQGVAKLGAQAAASSGNLVAEAKGLTFSWPGKDLIRNLDLTIMRGDRIGIVGPNGAGKTTLIRLLLGQLAPQSGTLRLGTRQEIIYFDQLREQLDPQKSVAWNLAGGDDSLVVNGKLKHVNAYLQDFLFSPERARNPVSILSGGERNRLLLARLFTRASNILVLDEPTNDLDAETMDLLEDLLLEYPGTILLVSHDRHFLDNVVSSLLIVDGKGTVEEFVGTWSDREAWEAKRRQEAKDARKEGKKSDRKGTEQGPGVTAVAGSPGGASSGAAAGSTVAGGTAAGGTGTAGAGKAEPAKASQFAPVAGSGRKLGFKEQRELEALPEQIAAKEARLEEIHAAMQDPGFWKQAPAVTAKIQADAKALEADIAASWERWTDLDSRA